MSGEEKPSTPGRFWLLWGACVLVASIPILHDLLDGGSIQRSSVLSSICISAAMTLGYLTLKGVRLLSPKGQTRVFIGIPLGLNLAIALSFAERHGPAGWLALIPVAVMGLVYWKASKSKAG